MKLQIAAISAVLALSAPAMAQNVPVSCTRDAIFAGGGAFNFTCKEDPVAPGPNATYPFGRQNYCIPYAATDANVPRGGADAVNGWANVANQHTALFFADDGPASPSACPIAGSHEVQGVGATN